MKIVSKPRPLPVSVHEALAAIATTGKGRCWYCDIRLPVADRAIADGWDVQRIEEQPVASIILVCPACLEREDRALRTRRPEGARNGNRPSGLELQPKRA